MVLKASFLLIYFSLMTSAQAQKTVAYQIYNAKGRKVSFSKMSRQLKKRDVVFFGEFHDDPIGHWMEYELLTDLYLEHRGNLMLGLEMFERDQQVLLDAYIKNSLTTEQFEDSCRLWINYKTDYKPIVEFAKEKGVKCVAGNIPRRFASLVYREGRSALDTLSIEERKWMAPLDFEIDSTLSQYQLLLEMQVHGVGNFLEAQAIKDATMAHFLAENYTPGLKFFHINGAFHTDFHQGIIWYLENEIKNIEIGSISTILQQDVLKLLPENKGRADFIICVNENMTRTH